ncbi:hypothetical protein KP509_1Z084100 [Ceratopteris richardii]|nr:hypothetical protein KP509_1Z084100 [Ceratopteris richardii]
MYAACGNVEDSYAVFSYMHEPDIYLWSAIILAYTNAGQTSKAIQLYQSMLGAQKLRPDAHILVAVLKACASSHALSEGKLVHAHSTESGLELVLHVGNILIDMYVRFGCLKDAQAVFDRMPRKDVVTYNALIAGYSSDGHGDKVQALCQKMQEEGIEPDNMTFLSLVRARNSRDNNNLDLNLAPIPTSWKLVYASELFKNLRNRSLASWSAMIAMYAEHGSQMKALSLYFDMLQEDLNPDRITFICVLKACSDLEVVKLIHYHIIESGCEIDLQVYNCLIDVYGQGGFLADARMLFDNMHSRCVVTWTSMISAYACYGSDQHAIGLFSKMLEDGVKPNEVTCLSAMRSCINMAALILGYAIYALVIESCFDSYVLVSNTAIDMFSKCNSLSDAYSVFQGMSKHTVVSWSTMISAYVQHGEHELSIGCLNGMLQEGIKPNPVIFICMLSVCYHLGFVDQGNYYLNAMENVYGIKPTLQHRNCLIELYGRTGQLKEATDLLQGMPNELDIVAWMSLLNQCKVHGNANLAKHCFDSITNVNLED